MNVTVYVPQEDASTLLTTTILSVRSPSATSVAVAPASTYDSPNSIFTSASPISVMIGAVVSETITSLTA